MATPGMSAGHKATTGFCAAFLWQGHDFPRILSQFLSHRMIESHCHTTFIVKDYGVTVCQPKRVDFGSASSAADGVRAYPLHSCGRALQSALWTVSR